MPTTDDPSRYGTSFADVYDLWYPGGDEHRVVATLARHLDPGARVLELGVGTGRLALALGGAGFEVVGLDASAEMLRRFVAKDRPASVRPVLADAARPSNWEEAGVHGRFACVLAACNLLLNLATPRAQRNCITGAAARLSDGGVFALELQQIRPDSSTGVSYAMSGATGDAPVVIATETDPDTGTVEGQHIELRADGTARIRPWSVHPVRLTTVDRWCAGSGLELMSRHADWSGTTWHHDSPTSVSIYRRCG